MSMVPWSRPSYSTPCLVGSGAECPHSPLIYSTSARSGVEFVFWVQRAWSCVWWAHEQCMDRKRQEGQVGPGVQHKRETGDFLMSST